MPTAKSKTKMKATKEQARRAHQALDAIHKDPHCSTYHGSRLELLHEFLDLVEKRLPSEEAVERDRVKKLTRAEKH